MIGAACNAAPKEAAKADSVAPISARISPTNLGNEVEVIGLDYAFSMPDSVDAGRAAFKFTNKGKVPHEYNVVLLKQGVTVGQYIDAANKEQGLAELRDAPVGVLFADPGKSSGGVLSAELLPGRSYAVQCIFTDSANAPTHRQLGMFKGFAVREAPAPAAVALKIDTIIGTDYAYTQYPRTLTSGWHNFAFVNAGKQKHEISISLMKVGVTIKQLLEHVEKGGDPNELLEDSYGVVHAESGVTPQGILGFEVKPGREYILVCTYADTPKSPPHFALGMVTSMLSSQ